jgi:hypothetical protein
MNKIVTLSLILIISFTFSNQYQGITKILTPEFNTADLSIPKSINFQGYLYRDEIPMDTTMNMWFGIYTALSGGSLLFQQTINNVEVVNGWFTVSLDNIPNSVFPVAGPTRYLEVKAPSTGPALEPRFSLVSVGYSYHSITSDTAEYAKAGQITRPITPQISGTEINKPCTLQTSVAFPNAVLRLKNTGSGHGIIIDSASYNGIYINRTGGDGVNVNRASRWGVRVDSAGDVGLCIFRTGEDAIWIGRPRYSGVYIDSAGYYGVRVGQVGIDGLYINKAGYNGIEISFTGEDGIYIYKADENGMYIDSAGSYGVQVMKAINGFRVDTASSHGVRVIYSGGDGVHVWDADRDGVRVWQATDNGVYINQANQDGIFIDNVGNDGVQINDAEYGMYVAHAEYDGILAGGNRSGGYFFGDNSAAEAVIAFAYGSTTTDTAIRAYGKGIATGGWVTGFDNGKEAPCIVSPERTIISYGTAQLNQEKAKIFFPEIFKENIRNDIPVRISLTPKGEPSGLLYLDKTDANGFQARLRRISEWGETTDITFDWIAIGTLKEPVTSAEAKADWEKLMQLREEKRTRNHKD